MSLQQCLQNGKYVWPISRHLGGSFHTCRVMNYHSAIKELNISFSSKITVNVTNFHVRHLCNSVAPGDLPELPRNLYIQPVGDKANSMPKDIFRNKTEMSSTEWEETIAFILQEDSQVTVHCCDAVVIKKCLQHCNYSLANSYLDHIARQGREPNLATLGAYLQLCGQVVDQCGEEKIFEVYQRITSQVKVLDSTLSKSAILALSSTREWKKALKHLPIIRKMSEICRSTYSAIIASAFRNGEYDTGFHYLDVMWQENKLPTDQVFLEWVKQCTALKTTEEKKAMMETLFHKLATYEIFPTLPVIQEIDLMYKEHLAWFSSYVTIPSSGKCPACGGQLKSPELDEEEFKQLQKEFMPRVLHGSDIFLSTSPKEWKIFQEFVDKHKPFTTVVDGLNASYSSGLINSTPGKRVNFLRDLIVKLERNVEGRILVIGRNHMNAWMPRDPPTWGTLRGSTPPWPRPRPGLFKNEKNVILYTLNNLTKDDGFFIYAALQSGYGTKVVTNDLLRDHLFRLGQTTLRETFRRWQRIHQIMIIPSLSGAHVLFPAVFNTSAQCGVNGGWHIPYDDKTPRHSYQLPTTWICLQPTPTRQNIQFSQVKNARKNEVKDSVAQYMENTQSRRQPRKYNFDQSDSMQQEKMRTSRATNFKHSGTSISKDLKQRLLRNINGSVSRKNNRKNEMMDLKTYSVLDIFDNTDK
ncbi:mitochondrial ribonuclease P catalytic subunit-like [Cherax quadricarinatus]